jgi:hypothetical protein
VQNFVLVTLPRYSGWHYVELRCLEYIVYCRGIGSMENYAGDFNSVRIQEVVLFPHAHLFAKEETGARKHGANLPSHFQWMEQILGGTVPGQVHL